MASGTITLRPNLGNGGGGGGSSLIPNSGQTFVANTSSSAGYTFNPANTEFVGGVIRQVLPAITLIGGINVLISGDSLTKNGGSNGVFDAGAHSSQQIAAGDGFVQFQCVSGSEIVAGLTHAFPGTAYTDIDFGFNPAGGQIYINENGTGHGPLGPYTASDVLKVSIESGVVKYRQNGTIIYTSLVAPIYPLFFAAAVSTIGDGATNILLLEPPALYTGDVITFPPFNYGGVGTLQAFSSSLIVDANSPHYTLNNLYYNGTAWVASNNSYAQSNDQATVNSFIPLLPAQNALTVRMITQTGFSQMSLSALTITYVGQTNSGASGVSSVNTLTGAVTLSAGSNITLTPSGNNIAISETTSILVFASTPSIGGAVSEALTVTGLLTTDTILSVSQKTQGSATRTSLPLIGWDTVVTNGLTAHWVADPGAGAVLLVAVKL